MKIGKYIFATLFMFSYAVAFSKDIPSVVISNGLVDVTTPTGKRQVISASGATSQSDAKFIDLTFNGYADLLMLRDRGANQEFYDVYLYSKSRDAYVYDKRLSGIPCLNVDVNRKELVGQCFHESACENWKEYYSVSSGGRISLVERRGTYCDPINGQGYTYDDRFRNGKKISSKIVPIENQSGN
ncbi:XAC2610-related protein [Paraburkholderia sacchari]|uniref:XAC2610-related protein n=1 Tax=Paraburkholderia sacchari TaxID=159450 RepID=UPI003D95BF29